MNKSRFGVRWDVVGGVFGATAGVLLAAAALHSDTPSLPPPTATVAPTVVAPPPSPIDPPPAEPSQSTPTLLEAGNASIELRTNALARELSTMWTRNPNELVRVIDDASRAAPASPSVTLLLAIAHAETNGKILDVSEAGAVGLAQATPIACRQEQVDGKLYVTADYTTGARAYIMKKPLGDADRIATMVLDKFGNPKTLKRAKRLLKAAKSLRREGVDELDLLDVWAGDSFFQSVKRMDRHNLRVLEELADLLDGGSKKELRAFRNRARSEYRALRDKQHRAWMEYEYDLADRRDALLVAHFSERADVVKKTRPYEAGEFLAEEFGCPLLPDEAGRVPGAPPRAEVGRSAETGEVEAGSGGDDRRPLQRRRPQRKAHARRPDRFPSGDRALHAQSARHPPAAGRGGGGDPSRHRRRDADHSVPVISVSQRINVLDNAANLRGETCCINTSPKMILKKHSVTQRATN